MTTWRKIRDTFEMNKTDQYRTENLRGVAGQMVWWEIRAGPYPHGADSLLALLHAHWKHLSSGKYDTPEVWEMAGCHELTQVERT